MKRLTTAVMIALLLGSTVWSSDSDPSCPFKIDSVFSETLGEYRSVSVYLPEGYLENDRSYPVLYFLDGQIETFMMNAVAAADHLAGAGRAPELIVVGVHATDSRRDYFPYPLERIPGSGGAPQFLKALADEIVPWFDGHYRTNGFSILSGGSNAGLFTSWASLARPESFSAYLAPSLSIGWCKDSMIALAEKCLNDPAYPCPTLYMNYGDDDIAGIVLNGAPEFIEIFEREAAGQDRRRSEIIPGGGHVPFVSIYNGLGFVFEGWAFPREQALASGLEGVENHYRQLTERFGFEVRIPENVLMDLGVDYYRAERWPESVSAFTRYVELYPSSVRARYLLGAGLERSGDVDGAIACFRKCLDLDPTFAQAQTKLDNLEKSTEQP